MRKWMLWALVLLCLAAGCTAQKRPSAPTQSAPMPSPNVYEDESFRNENGFLIYEGDTPCFVGVDVSAHQKEIDWEKVAAAGVEFAMIRVGYRGSTEGMLYEDEYFRSNMEGALAAGVEVGVYFFSQAVSIREALEEASFVLERIGDYEITYPVVFDWERQVGLHSRTNFTGGKTQTDCAVAFCSRVEREGYLPMVYASPSKAYRELDMARLSQWPFWLAHYTADRKPTGYRYHYDIWQYTSKGQVDGISTAVDLNLCLTDFAPEEGC